MGTGMVTPAEFRTLALALEGTTEAPHFDRTAFKFARIYATLAADGLSANLKLTRDVQELKCLTAPELFQPVDGGWGRMGWTSVALQLIGAEELASALAAAWKDAQPRPRSRSGSKAVGAARPLAGGKRKPRSPG